MAGGFVVTVTARLSQEIPGCNQGAADALFCDDDVMTVYVHRSDASVVYRVDVQEPSTPQAAAEQALRPLARLAPLRLASQVASVVVERDDPSAAMTGRRAVLDL